jgi:putative phosphoesterase
MRIAVISDTHMPRGGRRLPEACVERMRSADLIVHAGDLVTPEVLAALRRHGEVRAVRGNADDARVRALLPATRTLELEGVRLAVVHDGGPATGRLERLRSRFPDAAAVIFGHSHIPLHESAPDGFQIFNPGSATERRRALHHTMGMARVERGRVSFELVELD